MQINYCDLCGQPIHKERYILILVEEKDIAIQPVGKTSPRVTYEVCDSCVKLIKKIFTVKKQKLQEIENFIEETYSLKTKQPKIKKVINRKDKA
jgi:hypothetical protein